MLAACTAASHPADTPNPSAPHAEEHPGSAGPGDPGNPSDGAPSGNGTADEAPIDGASPATDPEPAKLPNTCAGLYQSESTTAGHQSFDDLAQDWAVTLFGPKTYEAVTSGDPQLICGWGLPNSDAIAVVAVSVISDREKSELVAALEGSEYEDVSKPYAKVGLSTDLAYERPPTKDMQYVSTVLIDGSVLIAVSQTTAGDFAPAALRTIQRLN